MADLKIDNIDNGVIFTAKIVPASSKTVIAGLLDGMLKVKISAPPEKGKANKNLVDFLAKKLGVKKNTVTIISGQTNPVKSIQVLGISDETLLKKLDLNK
ncbi:MAG: YggU family protein [Planctomycetes bacterium]|nr:YggU family protein [Planctomycetota bacterium]